MNTRYCPVCKAKIDLPEEETFHCRYCDIRIADPEEKFYQDFFSNIMILLWNRILRRGGCK